MAACIDKKEINTSKRINKVLLHAGATNNVYRVKDKEEFYILKEYYPKYYDDFILEKNMLGKLSHKGIIGLKDIQNQYTIIMESHGINLCEFIQKEKLSIHSAMAYFKQILAALSYLHSMNIIFCDLKTANVVISHGVTKLIDFASARSVGDISSSTYKTPTYASLESHLGIQYLYESTDIWSAGCILYELIKQKHFFTDGSTFSIISQILTILGLPNRHAYAGLALKHLDIIKYSENPVSNSVSNYASNSVSNSASNPVSNPVLIEENVLINSFLLKFFIYDPRQRITAKEAIEIIEEAIE